MFAYEKKTCFYDKYNLRKLIIQILKIITITYRLEIVQIVIKQQLNQYM